MTVTDQGVQYMKIQPPHHPCQLHLLPCYCTLLHIAIHITQCHAGHRGTKAA